MRCVTIPWAGGTAAVLEAVAAPGLVVVRFEGGSGSPLEPAVAARLASCIAVTVGDVGGRVWGGALEAALLLDLLYLREGAALDPSADPPPLAALGAVTRLGRRALRRVLLEPRPIPAAEAVELGLAAALVPPGDPLPLPVAGSLPALTAARDLLRSSSHPAARLALERAAFRLLLATGHPAEGARAFLERRDPEFP